mgnify:CR=1 FL=1
MEEKERDKALETALSLIRRRYGDGAIMKLGSGPRPRVEVISTGSLALDLALGVGVASSTHRSANTSGTRASRG